MPWPFPSSATSQRGLNAPRLVLVTAPAAEPLTAAEAKAWLKVEHTDDDTLITNLITAARRQFESLTGRSLVNTVWRAEWDQLPRAGTYAGAATIRELELPRAPLVSVAWVKYVDTAGAEQTFSSGSYTVETGLDANRFSRLWLDDDADWPELGSYPGALRCQFTAGYGSAASYVPEEIRVAVRLLVAHLYQNRVPVNIGNIVNELPFGLRALIEMHQIRTIA